MTHLDRSKPFKQVYGIAAHAFEQGGKLFDHDGNEIGAAEPQEDPPKRLGRPPKHVKAEPDQVDAQLNG